jgi:transposase InsO family protein
MWHHQEAQIFLFYLQKTSVDGAVVCFLKQKSEVADHFKNYANLIHTVTGNSVKILPTDNGGEFTGHIFLAWLSEKEIRLEKSAPHSSEQNGVSERANRTVVERDQCILHAKHLPIELWAEAIAYTVYTRNRVISKTSLITPFQRWYQTKPNISNLRIFGSASFIHVPKGERRELEPKSINCYFVG